MLGNVHQLNDLALKIETRGDGPGLSFDSGKASPAPPSSSPSSFSRYSKPEFYFIFFFFSSLTEAGVWNFLRQLPRGLTWTLPCRAAGRCVPPCPAPSSFQPMSGLPPPSSLRPFLHPYIAFPRPLAFELLAGSKCPEGIKRHAFFFQRPFMESTIRSESIGDHLRELLALWQLFVRRGSWSYSSLPHSLGNKPLGASGYRRWISNNRLHVAPSTS